MSQNERKILKLMQYGINSDIAQNLVNNGLWISKLREAKLDELAPIVGGKDRAREIKGKVKRKRIPKDIIQRLVDECYWSCCLCNDVEKRQHVVVHHIEPYENTQDNSYDNLVVVCPNHHVEVHSKSDLAGPLWPDSLIRQKKADFIIAIQQAKLGKRSFPGREPAPKYSWGALIRNCHHQLKSTLKAYANKFDPDLYVHRSIEDVFGEFVDSSKTGFLVVDKSGYGKSNMVCSLATSLLTDSKLVVLIRGDSDFRDERALEKLLCDALGFDPANYRFHLDSIVETLRLQSEHCFVFLDGVSESNTRSVASRALVNLLSSLEQYGRFKVCVTSRASAWQQISLDLPLKFFFTKGTQSAQSNLDESLPEARHFINHFSDSELEKCLFLYQRKYNVEFTLLDEAKDQVKHPLILRMFCEAHQGETMGGVSSVPVAKTFDLYLDKKSRAIENRLKHGIKSNQIIKALRLFSYEMWQKGDTTSVSESCWRPILLDLISVSPDVLIDELENEGIINLQVNAITLDQEIKIVFDQLREYLILQELFTLLSDKAHQSFLEKKDFKALFTSIKQEDAKDDDFKFLSLLGLMLPEVQERRYFLQDLLRYDFQSFCDCLVHISPTGNLSGCNDKALGELANELLCWYRLIATNIFPRIYTSFDPWLVNSSNKSKTIQLHMEVSPECKEYQYRYHLSDESEKPLDQPVKVVRTSQYPTFYASFTHGEKEFKVHDPEKGISLQTFRAPNNQVIRILNYKFLPRFPGDSYNVPERMSLYDVWQEVENLINKDSLPYQPISLLAERAWAIASEIPEINPEELDLVVFQNQIENLQKVYSGNDGESALIRSKIGELETLLMMLNKPLRINNNPFCDFQSIIKKSLSVCNLTDGELEKYLFTIMEKAVLSYRAIVDYNFPNLKNILNTYANMPMGVVIITDRLNVRYYFLPDKSWEEARYDSKVITDFAEGVTDPELKLSVRFDNKDSGADFEDAVVIRLRELKRGRPPVHPIDMVVSIDEFLSTTAVNHFVRKWLLQDLGLIFSF